MKRYQNNFKHHTWKAICSIMHTTHYILPSSSAVFGSFNYTFCEVNEILCHWWFFCTLIDKIQVSACFYDNNFSHKNIFVYSNNSLVLKKSQINFPSTWDIFNPWVKYILYSDNITYTCETIYRIKKLPNS